MTPLPWDKGDKGDSRANTQKLFVEYSFVNLTHFSVKDVQFPIKSTKIHKIHAPKFQDVFFLRVPNRRRQLPPVAQLGGGRARHSHILQVYRHSTSIQTPRIQVQTPRIQVQTPKYPPPTHTSPNTQKSSPDIQIQVQTPKIQVQTPKYKSQIRFRTDFCIQIFTPMISQPVSGSYFTDFAFRSLNPYIYMGNLYQLWRVLSTVKHGDRRENPRPKNLQGVVA